MDLFGLMIWEAPVCGQWGRMCIFLVGICGKALATKQKRTKNCSGSSNSFQTLVHLLMTYLLQVSTWGLRL